MGATKPVSTRESTSKPQARIRKRQTCVTWLDALEPSDVRSRLLVSGDRGFYEHERLWIARHCQYADCRASAQAQLAAKAERAQELKRDQEAASAAAEKQRQEDLARVRDSVAGLKAETHGTVREAALRASQLYLDGSVPRDLKQCIAIAAAEHLVAWSAIQAYLAGVGVRVLWAKVDPAEL